MTYTVAVHREGVLAAASASAWPSVGRGLWAAGDAGLAVVQGRAEPATARAVAMGGLESSGLADDQQALLVSRDGGRAVTGPACWAATSQAVSSVGGAVSNCSSSRDVAARMLEAATAAPGTAAAAVLTGLDVGAAHGGDARGTNAASLVVVGSDGRVADWRIDWSQDPVADLRAATEHLELLHELYDGDTSEATARALLTTANVPVVRLWAAIRLRRAGLDAAAPDVLGEWGQDALDHMGEHEKDPS